jgi:hypothetical protein
MYLWRPAVGRGRPCADKPEHRMLVGHSGWYVARAGDANGASKASIDRISEFEIIT